MGASIVAYWPGITEEQIDTQPGFTNDDRAWGNWMAEREEHLSRAYQTVAGMHNALDITPPLDGRVSAYHDRPYRVIHADRFAAATRAAIADEAIKQIPGDIGGVDQFVDSTDVTDRPELCGRLRALFA